MNIPRIRFANLPTPVESLDRLSSILQGPQILCKRDDLTGIGFGGNKVRKLEFVLADALAKNAQTLITVGGIQSNHCRQTAAVAAKFGLRCIVILSGTKPEMANGNLLLDELTGAQIIWTTREEREITLTQAFESSRDNGEKPYLIPLGASNATGTLGYMEAMKELDERHVQADWIVLASSSAGTQAGMVLGANLMGWEGKILGISIDHPVNELQQRVADLTNECAVLIGEEPFCKPNEIHVNADYLGAGYAVAGEAELEAIQLFARYEGLFLDPVYTGRAAAGMIDLIRKGFFKKNEKVLFWHTGGNSTLFAEPYCSQLDSLVKSSSFH